MNAKNLDEMNVKDYKGGLTRNGSGLMSLAWNLDRNGGSSGLP